MGTFLLYGTYNQLIIMIIVFIVNNSQTCRTSMEHSITLPDQWSQLAIGDASHQEVESTDVCIVSVSRCRLSTKSLSIHTLQSSSKLCSFNLTRGFRTKSVFLRFHRTPDFHVAKLQNNSASIERPIFT